MNEELGKDNADKSKNKDFQMNFEEENKNPFEQRLSEQANPFDSKDDDNPFLKDDPNKEPFNFTNENIEANRKESRSLSKVLLVLLVSIGLLVTAIWGLNQNKSKSNKPKQNQSANLNKEKKLNKEKRNKEDKASFSPNQSAGLLNTKEAKTQNAKKYDSCKVDEAQRYIASSMNDLDRVVSKVEQKTEEVKPQPNDARKDNIVVFLKDKVEKLSRAEEEIRAFSEPHMDKDLTVSFVDESSPCKVKDRPKYLAAWLDDLKLRINDLNNVLDLLENGDTLIASATKKAKTIKAADNPLSSFSEKQDKIEEKNKVTNDLLVPVNQKLVTKDKLDETKKLPVASAKVNKQSDPKLQNNIQSGTTRSKGEKKSEQFLVKKTDQKSNTITIKVEGKETNKEKITPSKPANNQNIVYSKVVSSTNSTKASSNISLNTSLNLPKQKTVQTKTEAKKSESPLVILEDKSLNVQKNSEVGSSSKAITPIMDKPFIPQQKIIPISPNTISNKPVTATDNYPNRNSYEYYDQYEGSVDQCIEYVEEQIDQCSNEAEYEYPNTKYSNQVTQYDYNYHPMSNCRGEAY